MNKNISTTGFAAGMARMVKPEIIIEGKIIRHFKHFRLEQSARTHHSFELILPHDVLENIQNHRLNEAQHFLGKRITIIFRYKDQENESPERTFVGVVTRVAFSQELMSLGDIVLKGGSPTLLLDAAPHFQSFGGEKPVNTAFIARSIISQGLGSQKFDVRIDTQNKSYIGYSSQYNETHYNYLARLAETYGEQFYYDGQTLHFGKLPLHEKSITLIYGSSVNKVQVELNATYIKPRYFGYNSSTDQKMKGIDRLVKHPGELPGQAYELNHEIYKMDSFVPAPLAANIDLDVDCSQDSSRGSAATEVFTVSGETMIPFLYPGCVADLEMRKPDSNATAYFTRIMITEITHDMDARGNYKGSFKAIAEGTGYMPRPEFTLPKAEPQVATVISNTDPQSQGRIRVRFQWQTSGSSTHFIRMMSPDAGGTGAVQQNRGFVAIPEVGDQVMVDFEYRHPDFPFAMGGMFHGKNGRGGGIDNHLKSLQTRSGIKVLMNDLEKSVTIEDPSGNSYFMDGKGNIRITAPGNMEFSAGKDIIMNSGKNLEVKTGNSMEFMSGNLAAFHMMSGAVFSTPLMEMSVPVHLNIQSGKTSLLSEEETTIQGRTTNIAGMEKLMIHSEQETTVNSKGQTHVLGKDGNSHSNTPRDYNPLEKKMDGRCLVHFRPQADWNGRGFGFDWMRAGDTHMDGDTPYIDIISSPGYAGKLRNDPEQYDKLKNTFSYYIYPHIDSNGFESRAPYVVPYLTLYPDAVITLDVLVNNRESPESIVLEYDQSKFQITHPPLPTAKGDHTIVLTITCRRAFRTDSMIKVIATYPGKFKSHKRDAGAVKVKANHTTYNLPVVFINVTTNLGNGRRGHIFSQNPIRARTTELLRQAYITPDFQDTLTMDMSSDHGTAPDCVPNGKSRFNGLFNIVIKEAIKPGTAVHPSDHVIQETDPAQSNRAITELRNLLDQQLQILYPERNFTGVKKIFFINQQYYTSNDVIAGTTPFPDRNHRLTDVAIIFRHHSVGTIAHELMHCMGLSHTFDPPSKFLFEKGKTDNVMDYPILPIRRISTFHWQWKTLQENARRVRRR